jgi:hypothetical protein
MKPAAIARLREITRLKYEAAASIRRRLARSEAEVEGWEANDGSAAVWELLRRGEFFSVTQASIQAACSKAIREAEEQVLEDEVIAAEIAIINAIHDTAGDVLDALAAFYEATRGDPDEVADLVDEPGSADDIEREGRFKLDILEAAAAVRGTVNEALTRMAAALRRQDVDRDEAEQSIRDLAFGDES